MKINTLGTGEIISLKVIIVSINQIYMCIHTLMFSRSIAQVTNGKPGEYLITRTYCMGLGEAMHCASGKAEKRDS